MSKRMIKYYLTPKAIKVGCKFEQPDQGNAGYDIYAAEATVLYPREEIWVSTGLHVEIPSSGLYPRVGLIRDRSSLANSGIHVHAGVIDSNFRGEVKIRLSYNPPVPDNNMRYAIAPGHRIAQMIIVQHLAWPTSRLDSIQSLSQTKRGEDGFGSTGI